MMLSFTVDGCGDATLSLALNDRAALLSPCTPLSFTLPVVALCGR